MLLQFKIKGEKLTRFTLYKIIFAQVSLLFNLSSIYHHINLDIIYVGIYLGLWHVQCSVQYFRCSDSESVCRSMMISAGWRSNMSTSDSDCSIDWLASDEDTCDSLKRSPTSSSSAAGAAATCCFQYGAQRRRSNCDEGRRWGRSDSAVSPVQGFTSVCAQQTFSVEAEHRPTRKRAHGGGSDTENKLFSHKVSFLLQKEKSSVPGAG